MSRTRLEQETVIIFNAAESEAWVTTSDPRMLRWMLRRYGKPTSMVGSEKRWVIPKGACFPRRKRAATGPKREVAHVV